MKVEVFYTDSFRSYMGTSKLHLDRNCFVLKNHKPGRGESNLILSMAVPEEDTNHKRFCGHCRRRTA